MTVTILKLKSVSFTEFCSNIEKMLDMNDVKVKREVFIKPNLCSPVKADTGIVTDPKTVKALIHVLRKRGAQRIVIGEDVAPGGDTKECFVKTGFDELARDEDIELVDLSEWKRKSVKCKFGELSLPDLGGMFYINVPKMKTHLNTVMTCSMKNQKGLLLAEDKKRFHRIGLHESIAELAMVIRPDFVLVDGILGLEGDGPGRMGRSIKMDLLVGGREQVGVDATCAQIMGIEPTEVEHIMIAHRLGGDRMYPEIIGERIEDVRYEFVRANPNHIHKLNIHIQCGDDGCSACNKAVVGMRDFIVGNPKYWLAFLRGGVLGRVDYLIGAKCKVPERGRRICVGNCTKKIADKYGLPLVKGCPPKSIDILKIL